MDNDGDNDILWEVNRGSLATSIPALMRNNGSNVFTNVRSTFIPSASVESNYSGKYFIFDYNNDGSLDIFEPGDNSSNARLQKHHQHQ
jgi:hypothetical protein